jgi:glutamine synthetase
VARDTNPDTAPAGIIEDLRKAGVRYVVGSFVDSGSINRVKCVPLAKLEKGTCPGRATGFSKCWATALSNDEFTTTRDLSETCVGDLRLVPDLTSLTQLAATPFWGWVALDQQLDDGTVFPACQRSFLKRMVREADERGYSLQMAFEFEYTVQRPSEDGTSFSPIHQGPGYSSAAWAEVQDLAAELLVALEDEGIGVESFHPEFADGQIEVALAVTDPVRCADWNVLLRHTARSVSRLRGYRCSFSPMALPGQPSFNGCHTHFSLWDRSSAKNLFSGGKRILQLTAEGEAFLAGVLCELPALVAISCPTVPSYARLQPHRWSGAWACWGHDNREAALRFVQGRPGVAAHRSNMEFKTPDSAAHPYLLPGAIIAAGLHGVEQEMSLPEPVAVDPSSLSERERAARGIALVPQTLSAATEALAASETLHEAMGDMLFDATVAVRRAEVEADGSRPMEQLFTEHRWRF